MQGRETEPTRMLLSLCGQRPVAFPHSFPFVVLVLIHTP